MYICRLTRAPAHQEGKLPFDLALDGGCSASLLALLQPGDAAWCDGGEGFQPPDLPLVSVAESRVFESLADLLDPNPRRLKRIVSVYALVTEVAKRMPLSEGSSKARLAAQCSVERILACICVKVSLLSPLPMGALQAVGTDKNWIVLRPKLAKWLCLCECYPYRMSFLVLIITDLVQKQKVNRLRRKHPSLQHDYKLVHYGKVKTSNAAANSVLPDSTVDLDTNLELADNMPIVEAYFRHVERYIYSHPTARKMLSLDGDPVRKTGAAVHIGGADHWGRSSLYHRACAGAIHCAAHLPSDRLRRRIG